MQGTSNTAIFCNPNYRHLFSGDIENQNYFSELRKIIKKDYGGKHNKIKRRFNRKNIISNHNKTCKHPFRSAYYCMICKSSSVCGECNRCIPWSSNAANNEKSCIVGMHCQFIFK